MSTRPTLFGPRAGHLRSFSWRCRCRALGVVVGCLIVGWIVGDAREARAGDLSPEARHEVETAFFRGRYEDVRRLLREARTKTDRWTAASWVGHLAVGDERLDLDQQRPIPVNRGHDRRP